MKIKAKLKIYSDVLLRPRDATIMLWKHRRTVAFLWKKRKFKQLRNFIYITYFILGEGVGKNILAPVWKFFPQLVPFPRDIEVEVTTKCYLKCIMCEHTYWKDKSYLNQDLTFEQFKAIVDSIPTLKYINPTGEGSSFLNPDFMEMLRYAKSKSIYIDFTHDFVFMTDEIARELIELGIERIYVSLEGATKETYEKIRVGANFDTVTNNIKRFVELKKEMESPLPEMCFRMSFFKDNVHEVEQMVDLIHSFGGSRDIGDEPSIEFVGLLEFKETEGWVTEIPQNVVDRANIMGEKYGFTMFWAHISHLESRKVPLAYCTCWSEPYIMIRGYVLPCCSVLMSNKRPFLEKYAFGNINEKPFKEIWYSERYRKFRKLVTNPRGKVPILCVGCRGFDSTERIKIYGIACDI